MPENFQDSENENEFAADEPAPDQPAPPPVEPELTLREPTLSAAEFSEPELSSLPDEDTPFATFDTTTAPPDFSEPADALETGSPLDITQNTPIADESPTQSTLPLPDTAPVSEPVSMDIEPPSSPETGDEPSIAELLEMETLSSGENNTPLESLIFEPLSSEPISSEPSHTPQSLPESTPNAGFALQEQPATWLPPAQSTLPSSSPPNNSQRFLIRCSGCCGCFILTWIGLMIALYIIGSGLG